MAAQVHEGRAVLTEKINTQLNMFLSSIETAIRNNLPNRNVLAETTLAGLLNRIHGWDLVNANSIRQNYPGIDLIDTGRKIGIQITSTNTLKKVDNTLEKVAGLPDDVEINHLHIVIITNANPTDTMKGRKQAPYFSGSDDIWNLPALLRQIMDLEVSKLENICEYLDGELGTLRQKMEQPYLNLPLSSALDADSFVGRHDELEKIRQKLGSRVKPIVLSGLGGMGKTELAVRFGLDYDGNVYFVRFSDSFTTTVKAMFKGVRPQPVDLPPEAEQYNTVLSLLEKCGENDILIIDNVDADSGTLGDLMRDDAFKALKAMKLRLILTTRFDQDRAVDVAPMPNRNLYEIFEKHGASVEKDQMDALIEAVNGHTLTIDLIARTLNGKGWRKVNAEMLLNDLKTNALPGANYRKIATDYSQSEGQAQIYQHLKVVFDAAGVPEEGQNVLRCATLLPADGMNGEYFHAALTEAEQEAFEALIDHGWLNGENGVVSIHPVIRLVCREELKPDGESCGGFLDALWKQLKRDEYDPAKFTQIAAVFAQAMEIQAEAESRVEWLNHSGRLWLNLAQYDAAIALYAQYLPDLERSLSSTSPSLATAYNNTGAIYNALGDHNKALTFKLKSMTIKENILPAGHHKLATAYNNVGVTYSDLGDHAKAQEFKMKALEIWEKVLPPEHPSLATAYNNVGCTYGDLGDHGKELEYQLKALGIREKVLPPDHSNLALSYNNVGVAYFYLNDYSLALEYLKKALAIYERALPAGHPHIASTRESIENLRTWL